jgi:hypothetical protein
LGVKQVARLLNDEPAHIRLDVPAISAKLTACMPAAAGLSVKTFRTARSTFLAAVKVSGLKSVQRHTAPLSAEWKQLFAELSGKRAHLGLSRLARYASHNGIEPEEVDDATMEAFITAVRDNTLHRKPNGLHRKVAMIWNEAARRSRARLKPVKVPSFRSPSRRIDWMLLPHSFRKDVDRYLDWCACVDPFAADVRSRALAPQSVNLVPWSTVGISA